MNYEQTKHKIFTLWNDQIINQDYLDNQLLIKNKVINSNNQYNKKIVFESEWYNEFIDSSNI